MKKLLLVLLLIIIAAGGYGIYHELHQEAVISDTLSSRAQEYIAEQSNADTDWKLADFDGPQGTDTRNKRIERSGCYSFVIPYRITVTKEEENCVSRYSFDLPKGAILISISELNNQSLDSVSAVSFRRRHSDEYTEQTKVINGKTFLMFTLKGDIYEKNVFYHGGSFYLTFNLLTKTNENLDQDIEKMLGSLEIEYN